jgi:hypothetical protein
VFGAAALSGEFSSDDDGGGSSAAEDVSVYSCSSGLGEPSEAWPKATIEVTNHGSRAAGYRVGISFVANDGTALGDRTIRVDSLAPGHIARRDATGNPGNRDYTDVTCKITDAVRT